jgi:capsular polysaccharide biosynthesis protein
VSQQALDLRRSWQIVRRHKIIVAGCAALGLAAGAWLIVLKPAMFTGNAVVLLPSSTQDTRTQVLIAGSDPVLGGAQHSTHPPLSLQTLRSRVQVSSLTSNVISISAQGPSAAQADAAANAVAESYVDYLGSGSTPGRAVQAQLLEPATDATGKSLPVRLLLDCGLGALIGLLAGVIAALIISRSERRLGERDEIAESIGVPVLASIPVSRPSGTAGWRKLFQEYEPGAVDAWRLRKALQHLGLGLADGDGGESSLTVLSLSSDRKALSLGPQLAVFAASLGIPTTLVMGPQQDTNVTATLRAACAAPPARSKLSANLQITVSDHDAPVPPPDTALAIVVAVVDAKAPEVAGVMSTTATVLGVSADAATAEQLARVAASAAADGRHIAGILVADPDSADHTTGRIQPLARPA